MLTVEPGDDVWVLTYYGPKCAKFVSQWPVCDKALVEYENNSPELVSLKTVYMTETECYVAAALRKQFEAMAALKMSTEYSAKADENKPAR